jgi:hypothetical protein
MTAAGISGRRHKAQETSTKDALACGDLFAYRRYAYARSAAEVGDWRAGVLTRGLGARA